MPRINFINAKGEKAHFAFEVEEIEHFCGGCYGHNFLVNPGHKVISDWSGEISKVYKYKDLLKGIIQSLRIDGVALMFDRRGGYADSLLFANVENGSIVSVNRMRYKLEVSPWYVNRNSRRNCRHLTITRLGRR